MSPGVPDSYWQSELSEAQESYRFFLQSRLTLMYYSYTALFGVIAFWGSQLSALQTLSGLWRASALVAMSVSFTLLVLILLLCEAVGHNWQNAVSNHQHRWVHAAKSLGGSDGWDKTCEQLASHPVPGGGGLYYSSRAMALMADIGLGVAMTAAAAVSVLGPRAVDESFALTTFAVGGTCTALAFGVVGVLLIQRSSLTTKVARLIRSRWGNTMPRRLYVPLSWMLFAALASLTWFLLKALAAV